MTLRIDGDIVAKGKGSAALGDPLEALAWLARKLIARGRHLRAGDIILTGALAPMTPLPPRALVEVEVDRLGRVAFRSGD
jgi:2-keto-4-pentenoate hydratase